MTLNIIAILVLCGLITNMMSALFGIGGGVLMVPVLHTLFPEFPLQMVAATSLTIVMGSSFINLVYFYKQKIKINMKNMFIWSIGMIIGVQIGFELSFLISNIVIVSIFIITLSILAIRILFFTKKEEQRELALSDEHYKGIFLCLFGGSVAGITGVGGGSIMAPLISQLHSVKAHQIAVYTNYMMVIGGLGSLYGYLSKSPSFILNNSWQIGYVNLSIVFIVVISSFISSFFSMKLRNKLTSNQSRKTLGFLLLIIAFYMLTIEMI